MNIISIEALPGDIVYACPVCGWRVVLTKDGAALWTRHDGIVPKCVKDDVELIKTVIS